MQLYAKSAPTPAYKYRCGGLVASVEATLLLPRWLVQDLNQVCFADSHLTVALAVSLPVLLLFSVGFPLGQVRVGLSAWQCMGA